MSKNPIQLVFDRPIHEIVARYQHQIFMAREEPLFNSVFSSHLLESEKHCIKKELVSDEVLMVPYAKEVEQTIKEVWRKAIELIYGTEKHLGVIHPLGVHEVRHDDGRYLLTFFLDVVVTKNEFRRFWEI